MTKNVCHKGIHLRARIVLKVRIYEEKIRQEHGIKDFFIL